MASGLSGNFIDYGRCAVQVRTMNLHMALSTMRPAPGTLMMNFLLISGSLSFSEPENAIYVSSPLG